MRDLKDLNELTHVTINSAQIKSIIRIIISNKRIRVTQRHVRIK